MAFMTSDSRMTATLDGALGRAGVAMSFFMITAGFGTHLSNSSRNLLTEGWAAYRKFAIERNDRIVLTLWLNLTLLFFFRPWVNGTNFSYTAVYFLEYLFCVLTFNMAPVLKPEAELCQGDGWFIGALVPLTLLYPVFAWVIKTIDRRAGSCGLVVLAVIAWMTYFVPLLAILLNRVESDAPDYPDENVVGKLGIQRFIVYHTVDFFFGCVIANVVLKHRSYDEVREDTLLPMWRSASGTTNLFVYVRGALADLSVLSVFIYVFTTFGSTVCKTRFVTCMDMDMKLAIDSHAFVPVFALWLYGSAAKGGMGFFSRILEFPGLVAFGYFALDAYLLSEPLGTFSIGVGFEMRGQKFVNSEGFVTYLILLWLLSGVNAQCIMAPLTTWTRSVIEGGCTAAACFGSGVESDLKKS
jgi:hypothetical protein